MASSSPHEPQDRRVLAALLPRYVEPAAGMVPAQMIVLGAIFCGIAIVSDGIWAVLAARALRWLVNDPRRLAWTPVGGGLVMVALGLSLALG